MEKGEKVGFFKFASMKQAKDGYANWKNNKEVTPLKKKAATKVVESDEGSNEEAKKNIQELSPEMQALF